jgi:hypothetical protein
LHGERQQGRSVSTLRRVFQQTVDGIPQKVGAAGVLSGFDKVINLLDIDSNAASRANSSLHVIKTIPMYSIWNIRLLTA